MKIAIHPKLIALLIGIFFLLNPDFALGFPLSKLSPVSVPGPEKLPEIIVIHNPEIVKAEKEALLILPGFGDNRKRRKAQKKFFANCGYDLYIPNYKNRKSIAATVQNLFDFYHDHDLVQYKKVHVFSYILGSWVLNTYINQYGKENIASIIFDRSPLQERAPRVIRDRIPTIGKIMKGKVLIELSRMTYPPIPMQGIKIGIVVESKATKLIKMFRKTTLGYGPIDWKNLNFNQPYDDLLYTPLNHDQLYTRFEVIGEDLLHFFKAGTFTANARRIPYDWDVFKAWIPE
ncbi:MAG: hypothetical protein ACKVT2_10550 [Saprospiraceae bacterium]